MTKAFGAYFWILCVLALSLLLYKVVADIELAWSPDAVTEAAQ